MKLLPAIAAALLLSGCVGVKSIQPLYTTETLVSEPALVGAWTDDKGEVTMRVRQKDKDYSVVVREKKKKDEMFQVRLVRIDGDLFADVTDHQNSTMAIPAHAFAKITLDGKDKAILAFFDSGWVRQQIRQTKQVEFVLSTPTPGGKEEDRDLYLLAPPVQLTELIRRYRTESKAFGEPAKLHRTSGR